MAQYLLSVWHDEDYEADHQALGLVEVPTTGDGASYPTAVSADYLP